jgi:RNA polymerase sigma-54 factor
MSDVDRIIAMTIIESLDDRGYLTVTVDEIVAMMNAQDDLLTEGDELEADEVLACSNSIR